MMKTDSLKTGDGGGKARCDKQASTRGGLGMGIALFGALLAGCAAPQRPRGDWSGPVQLPATEGGPQIIVYGPLTPLLPEFDETPAIELFLFGPNDYGKTILRNPQGMTVCGQRLLVCDQGRLEVVAVNLSSGKSTIWTDPNRPPRCPVDVASDPAGNIYVADTTVRAVLVYGPDGKFLQEIAPSQDTDRRFRPCSVLPDGNVLYIGDLASRSVQRWDVSARSWLTPLRLPGERRSLIAPSGLALGSDGTLLIVDAVGGIVFRLGADGTWQEPVGRPGRRDGEFVRPKQVCCTPSGLILVTDSGRQSVPVFDSGGKFVTEIHEQPGSWRGFTLPTGILLISGETRGLIEGYVLSKGWPKAAEYVIVSDALGGTSLTLLGIVPRPAEGGPNAG